MRSLFFWSFPLLACNLATAQEPPAATGGLAEAIRSGDPARIEAAVDSAWNAGAGAVAELAEILEPGEEADPAAADLQRRAALRALWRLTHGATAPDEDSRRTQERRRATGAALIAAVERQPPLPLRDRQELLQMLGEVANDRQSVVRLASWLDHSDLGPAALAALQRCAHPAAEEALVQRLQSAGALPVREIVKALGARRATTAVEPLLVLATAADPGLAAAARHALARIGDPRAAAVLAAALQRDPAAAADDWLRFAAAQRPNGELRAALLTGYGLLLQRPEPHLRLAGLHGLAAIEAEGLTATLLARLEDEDPQVRRTARNLLAESQVAGVDDAVQKALAGATPALRPELLRVLAARRPPGVVATLLQVARDEAAPDRAVALELLGAFPDPAHDELLLAALGVADRDVRRAAGQSLWRQITAVQGGADRQRVLRLLHALVDRAADDELRRQAIAALGELGDPASLPHLEPYAKDARYKDQVAAARARIAMALASESPDRAVQLMLAAYRLSGDRGQRRQVARHLAELGFDASSLVASSGFLQDWQVLGPWPPADKETLASHPFDRAGPDPTRPVEIGERSLTWQPVHTDDPDGVVDLTFLEPHDNVSAFALAILDWSADQDVLLRIGSDDAVAVWVNGDLVHENFVMRGVTPDQDSCRAHLRKGANWILLRVHQGGGDWGFTVRLCDAGGEPIDLGER